MMDLDTHVAALDIERTLTLKRADHMAPLFEAAKRSRSAPAGDRARAAALSRVSVVGHLARAMRSLRWVLRPVHA